MTSLSNGHIINLTNLQTPKHSTHAAAQVLYQISLNCNLKDRKRNQEFIKIITRIVRRYIYIGKPKRDLETTVNEHFINIKNREIEKSAIAAHVLKEKHSMVHKPVLLKQASNKQELTN